MSRSRFTAIEKLTLLSELEQSDSSINSFAKQHGLSRHTLERWRSLYNREGIVGLEEVRKNKHYSQSFKLTAVQAYLSGEGTIAEIANRFELRSQTQLGNWVNRYNRDKSLMALPSGKQVPTMSRKTTFEERIEIVEYVTKHNHNYTEAAEHFKVSYQQARSWVIKTRNGGYKALVDNRGHHKSAAELTEVDKLKLEIRQLKAQLADKELVEAFAKKLLELQHKE